MATLGTDGCQPDPLPPEKSWPIVNYASSAAIEETLACGTFKAAHPGVGEYQEEL